MDTYEYVLQVSNLIVGDKNVSTYRISFKLTLDLDFSGSSWKTYFHSRLIKQQFYIPQFFFSNTPLLSSHIAKQAYVCVL